MQVTDAGNPNLASATVSIGSGFVSSEDQLAASPPGGSGISALYNAANGVLTFSGVSSLANYQAALESVTYANIGSDPHTAARTVSFVVSDGVVSSSPVTKSVSVVQVDQAPTISAPIAAQAVPQGGSIVLSTANGNAISVADVDANGGQEQLTLAAASGTLTLAGTAGLTFTTGTGTANPTMVFKGTLANINAALNGLTYAAPSVAGTSTLTVTINDLGNTGLGGPLSATASVPISISAVQPVVSLTKSSPSFTQGGSAAVLDAGLTVADPGNPKLASATVVIASGFAANQDVLTFTQVTGIIGGYNSVSVALTFTGSATLATYQTLLESVTYKDTSNDPSTTPRNISFVVNDGSTSSLPVFKTVTVVEVNQTPTLTVPVSTPQPLSVTENNNLIFSAANSNAISVADIDANGGLEQVTLQVSHGTLTLGSTTGLTFSIGSGSNSPSSQFKGSIANLNAALNGLVYSPSPGFDNNSDTLLVTINDLGNSGIGGALSASGSVNMYVYAANAPAILPGGGTLNYTDSQGAVVIDPSIQVTDPVPNSQIASATVTISSGLVPTEDVLAFTEIGNITGTYTSASGQLVLSGTDSIANYQAALDSVTYQDTAANPNTQPRTVNLTVTDSFSNVSSPAVRVINVAHANLCR